jgi:hypothetical protein
LGGVSCWGRTEVGPAPFPQLATPHHRPDARLACWQRGKVAVDVGLCPAGCPIRPNSPQCQPLDCTHKVLGGAEFVPHVRGCVPASVQPLESCRVYWSRGGWPACSKAPRRADDKIGVGLGAVCRSMAGIRGWDQRLGSEWQQWVMQGLCGLSSCGPYRTTWPPPLSTRRLLPGGGARGLMK